MANKPDQELLEELGAVFCHFEEMCELKSAAVDSPVNISASSDAARLTQAYAMLKLQKTLRYK